MKEMVISYKKGFELRSTISSIFKQHFLILLFVKRDYNTYYKQTVLGPIWFFIQPIFTMVVYVFIFGQVAGIETGKTPQPLFFLSGIIMWTYFSDNTLKISSTFLDNAHIFGKVYFPRIVMPIANMLTAYIKLFIQVVLLGILCIYYGLEYIQFDWKLILIPVFLFFLGVFSTAIGIIISALTTKYRDLKFLTQFGIQLLMYGSAVVWPFELIQNLFSDKYQWLHNLALFNPLIHFIEGIRYILFGEGFFDPFWSLYSCFISIVMFILGLLIFTRVEKDFMDTI